MKRIDPRVVGGVLLAILLVIFIRSFRVQKSPPIEVIKTSPMHSVAVALRFSPDNQRLISAGAVSESGVMRDVLNRYYFYEHGDKRLRVWNVQSGQQVWRLPSSPISSNWGSNGGSVLLMPDFKTMLTTWGAWEVKPVEIHSFHFDKYIQVNNGNIGSLALSPDGKILVIGMTCAVEFRDVPTFKVIRTYRHNGQGTNLQFGPDSSTVIASWGSGRSNQAVNVATAKQIRYPRWFYRVRNSDAYAFAPDGNTLAMARDKNIEIWTTPRDYAGKKLRTFTTRLSKVSVLQFSPNGKILAAVGESSTTTPVPFFKL